MANPMPKLGFRPISEEQNTFRYEPGNAGAGTRVDVRNTQGFWKGDVGAGMIHHVAWRVATNHETLEKMWATGIDL
ncbi:MAG TPA: hypothetical protein VL485_06735 [Ktedonobacteraceae bacterium]|nr:hypothetical protein [Ktedonobacteraceae bacterium]